MNYFAVLVAALINMVLGAAWYGIFKVPWMKAMNIKESDGMPKGVAQSYGWSALASLVLAWVMALFTSYASSAAQGALFGFLAWLGFVVTTSLNSVLWEQKPLMLYWLNIVYTLLSFVAMGALLAGWT